MDSERREDDTPIPENLEEILTEAQRQALPGIKFSGWEPNFMRKQLFQPPVLILHNPNDDRTGMLDGDGIFSLQTDTDECKEEDQPAKSLLYI